MIQLDVNNVKSPSLICSNNRVYVVQKYAQESVVHAKK